MNVSANDILLQLADFRSQALNSLFNINTETEQKSSGSSFSQILNGKLAGGTDSSGMNMSLRDPLSGYNMMSFINNSGVQFKAQYAELSAMGSSVDHLEQVGEKLSDIDTSTADSDMKAQLQDFVSQYNQWVDRFGADVKDGGVLDNVQAAEVSLFELEQNISSIFNGADAGIGGLGELGIEIDPVTKHATFDTNRFDSALANNRNGVVSAIDQFSANFAKSADLLNDKGNFIQNALDNRSRAIDFINSHKSSLQSEFGTGAAPTPSSQVAQALAAYEKAHALS
ncbi:hypothetical protein DLREEDagrD3_24830 [Denitratisoma sp. agr-D3]